MTKSSSQATSSIVLQCSIVGGYPFLWCSDNTQSNPVASLRKAIQELELPIPMLASELRQFSRAHGRQYIPIQGKLLAVEEFFSLLRTHQSWDNENVTFGASWHWFRLVTLFALKLVEEGSYYPSLHYITPHSVAGWIPWIQQRHLDSYLSLVTAPPEVSEVVVSPSQPPIEEEELIQHFLLFLVDKSIRWGNKSQHVQLNTLGSWCDNWLHGLLNQDGRMRWSEPRIVEPIANLNQLTHLPYTTSNRSQTAKAELILNLLPEEGGQSWSLAWAVTCNTDSLSLREWEELEECDIKQRRFLGSQLTLAARVFGSEHPEVFSHPYSKKLNLQQVEIFLERFRTGIHSLNIPLNTLDSLAVSKPSQVNLSLAVQQSGSASGSENTWENSFELEWGATVQGYSVSQQLLQQWLNQDSALVEVDDNWFHIDPDSLAKVQEILQRQNRKQKSFTGREILSTVLQNQPTLDGVDIESINLEGTWLQERVEALRSPESWSLLNTPQGFQGELRGYQQRGLSWLSFLSKCQLGGCLADDMGLGKTIQTLAYIRYQSLHAHSNRFMVVCPTSLLSNWQREANRFVPELNVIRYHGPERGEIELPQADAEPTLLLTSYHTYNIDSNKLGPILWDAIILDEAQYIKNPQTQQSRSVRKINAKQRFALSGTPVENRLLDMWSIMDFLNPGLLGTRARFQKDFVTPIEKHNDQQKLSQLQGVLKPFILRRTKLDPEIREELPDKQESKIYCELSNRQRSLYEHVLQSSMGEIKQSESLARRGLILKLLTHLKQICNHPAQFLGEDLVQRSHSGKLDCLHDLLEAIFEQGDSVIIFSQYRVMLDLLSNYMGENFSHNISCIHGGLSPKKRQTIIDNFQDPEAPPQALLLTLKTGGVGLNLTKASHVVHYDRWWNPAVESQATDRTHRLGQTKAVTVHKLIAQGTLEESIDELLTRKSALADHIVQSDEKWLTELDSDQLLATLSLSSGSVLSQ